MVRFCFFLTFLFTLNACDTNVEADPVQFRGGEKCDWCMANQAEMLEKAKQEYIEGDCSLGTMLACFDQGVLTDVECEELVLMQGGQTDTHQKWLQLNEEAMEACAEVCE